MMNAKIPSALSIRYWELFFLRIFVTAIFWCSTANIVYGQIDSSYIGDVKGYVSKIDSLIETGSPLIVPGVSEGPVQISITIDSGIHKYSRVYSGGFAIYTASNKKVDTVYRIMYHDNLFLNLYEYYYYQRNQLVQAIILLQDWEHGRKTIYKKEVYFQLQNGTTREEVRIDTNFLERKYSWRVNIDLSAKGVEYLNQLLAHRF